MARYTSRPDEALGRLECVTIRTEVNSPAVFDYIHHKGHNFWSYSIPFAYMPFVERLYTELHSRRAEVVQGYERLIEMRLLHQCGRNGELSQACKGDGAWALVSEWECDQDRQLGPEHKLVERDLPDRWTLGVEPWIATAAPGWASRRKECGAERAKQESYYAHDMAFYRQDFNLEAFKQRISSYLYGLDIADFANLRSNWRADDYGPVRIPLKSDTDSD